MSYVDLKMFETDNSFFVNSETENSKSSDLDDCCHHIENMSTNIQMFSIFLSSLVITK
jgi:hypothetical protein